MLKNSPLDAAMARMAAAINGILEPCGPALYLHGSVVLGDFRQGWSDIDLLCLTERPLSREQAETLVRLRQKLLQEEPDNPFYRSFEGGFLTPEAFLRGTPDRVVYWGTGG